MTKNNVTHKKPEKN